eukprot:g4238.t1
MFPIITCTLLVILCEIVSASSLPDTGPYKTKRTEIKLDVLDSTDPRLDVYAPIEAGNKTFPLLVYSHGAGGGGQIDWLAYIPLLSKIASYGFVVTSTRSCNEGCHDDCKSLDHDPSCFGNFYKEKYKIIEWSKNKTSPIYSLIDHNIGIGIAGHSMGGQATVFAGSYQNASEHNIKAAVLHHPYTHELPQINVPFLAMTGTDDSVADPSWCQTLFDKSVVRNRGFINKNKANHEEPIFWFNDIPLARYTA